MKKKISIIGSGSSYTPLFVDKVLKNLDEFPVAEIKLFDISETNALTTLSFMKRLLKKSGKDIRMVLSGSLEQALEGVDFVLTQIRVGGLEARKKDIQLGLEFDLLGQETTGIGGFAKALRTTPEILNIAHRMQEYSSREAWLINFTNPAGIITEAVLKNTKTKAVGICNCSLSMVRDIAALFNIAPETISYDYAGANHLAGITRLEHEGKDILSETINRLAESELGNMKNVPDFELPASLMKRAGFIPVSYLKYFWFTERIVKYLKRKKKTRADEVMELEKEIKAYYIDKRNYKIPEAMSLRAGANYNEMAYRVMSALAGVKTDRLSVIAFNRGAVAPFAPSEVLEIPAIISENRIDPVAIGALPVALEALVQQVKKYETLTVKAAINKNRETALLAMLIHPLIGDTDRIEIIFDRLLEYNESFIGKWS